MRSHFQTLAADELEDVEMSSVDGEVDPARRARLLALQAALRDEDDGWQDWVKLEGQPGLARFRVEIDKWLSEPVNWSYSDFWPDGWSGQGMAMQFFQQLDRDVLNDLGVVIVEGEHPGSSYYAAELRDTIEQGNQAALRLGLPFRFREEAA